MIILESGEALGDADYPIGTVEERRRTIVALVTNRLKHHRTLTGALACLNASMRDLVVRAMFRDACATNPHWCNLRPEALIEAMSAGNAPRLQVISLWGQVCDIVRTDMGGLHLGADLETLRDATRGGAHYAVRTPAPVEKPLPGTPFVWTGRESGYDRWMQEMMKNMPESWDCDDSAEYMVAEYVRTLEARCDAAGISRERYAGPDA